MERNEQFERMRALHMAATGRDLHTDIPLSNVALGYRPEQGIADLIMPVIDVPNQSGFVTEFFSKDQLRVERTRRAPGTEANRVDREVGSQSYFCKNYALKTGVTVEDMANADAVKRSVLFDGAAEFLVTKHWLDWETRLSSLISTSNVGSSAGVASAWNGAGNPIANINTALDVVKDTTGVRANCILMGEKAWNSFRRDSTVRNLIYGTNNGGGFATIQAVKDLFEVDEFLISRSVKNTANEAAAESLSRVLADHVLCYVKPKKPGINIPSWGYSYRWSVPGVPSFQAERLAYDDKRKCTDVEVGYYQDEKVTGSRYAFLLLAVNSST